MTAAKRKILVSNDDGITAPGLRALVAELVKEQALDVYVCAPSGERSAQSHAITLGRYLLASPHTDLPGVKIAFGVDGTPADSVMLALNSELLAEPGSAPGSTSTNGSPNGPAAQPPDFDMIVSGINRGDNCGLHVIYSGTVGAAREAACKGVPSIALSLDNHSARKLEDYTLSATLSASLIKGALGLLLGQAPDQAPIRSFVNAVLNVNFPSSQGRQCKGFHLTHMSQACVFPAFREVLEATGPHLPLIDEHTPNSRVFRNYAGAVRTDDAEGGDSWAVKRGWVSVCPLSLRQDFLPTASQQQEHQALSEQVMTATSAIIEVAAQDAEMSVAGLGAKL